MVEIQEAQALEGFDHWVCYFLITIHFMIFVGLLIPLPICNTIYILRGLYERKRGITRVDIMESVKRSSPITIVSKGIREL